MTTQVNTNLLKAFVMEKMNGESLNRVEAKRLEISESDLIKADKDVNGEIDIDEILDDTNLYEQFAVMYVEEHDKVEAKDKDKEKEEQNKVSDKSKPKA